MNNIIEELLTDENLGVNKFLSNEEEKELFKLLKLDLSLREDIQTIILKSNIKLVYSIAKKYHPVVTLSNEDIVQLGLIGMSKAIDKFDYTKNVKFSTYATYWIKQSISKGMQKVLRNLEEPLNIIELRKKYLETELELTQSLGRIVSIKEVANKMGINESELSTIFITNKIVSLDAIDEKNKDINVQTNENSIDKLSILEAIDMLNEQQKEIIKTRYGFYDGMYHSLSEVAKIFNISKQRVQIIEKKALEIMKNYLKS